MDKTPKRGKKKILIALAILFLLLIFKLALVYQSHSNKAPASPESDIVLNQTQSDNGTAQQNTTNSGRIGLPLFLILLAPLFWIFLRMMRGSDYND